MRPPQKLWSTNVGNVAAITLIAACGLYMFRWVFSPEVTFFDDDWYWLLNEAFSPWSAYRSIWTVLPAGLFGDRPIEGMSIMVLHQIFELDHTGYAAVILTIHIANAVLLYWLAAKLLSSRFYGMIAGTLFVIDHSVAYPAWWLATIADSASLFFCLCALLVFVSQRRYSGVLTALLYYLAVKSKEVALPFPLLLFAYSVLTHVSAATLSDFAKSVRAALRSTWPVLVAFVVLFGFSMFYFALAMKTRLQGYGPYVPQFNLPTAIDGTEIYLGNIAFSLITPVQALIGFLVLTGIAILIFDRVAIFGSIGFFAATGPVLFLPHQRYPYYAYAASAYIALMLVALVQRGDRWMAGKVGAGSDVVAKAAVLLVTMWFTHFVSGIDLGRDWLLAIMREDSKARKTLASALPHVENRSTIVVTGVPPGSDNIFTKPPCVALRVIFGVWELECQVEGADADLVTLYERTKGPKVLLGYDHGDVSLRARSP